MERVRFIYDLRSTRDPDFCFRFLINLAEVDGQATTGKWVLFILPFITVMREGDDLHNFTILLSYNSRHLHRSRSRHLRRRCLTGPTRRVHPHRRNRRPRLRLRLRLHHLRIRKPNK
jgi:hypothetical protein